MAVQWSVNFQMANGLLKSDTRSGMAMRLVFDLGLHIDTRPRVLNKEMSEAENIARSTAFWGTYIIDQ
jgi:hypothetical protein